MLARFVVDSHARSIPKGSNLEERAQSGNDGAGPTDPDVLIHQYACQTFFKLLIMLLFLLNIFCTRYCHKIC
jgi:hypothetical protein